MSRTYPPCNSSGRRGRWPASPGPGGPRRARPSLRRPAWNNPRTCRPARRRARFAALPSAEWFCLPLPSLVFLDDLLELRRHLGDRGLLDLHAAVGGLADDQVHLAEVVPLG